MPPSLAQRLLDAAWDRVCAAVETGLRGSSTEHALADVVPLGERPYGRPNVGLPPWAGASAARERIAVDVSDEYVQFRFDCRLPLDVDALQDFDADDAVRDWAAAARRRELTAVLEMLAAVGTPVRLEGQAIRRTLPEGYGTPQFLLWEPLPAGLDKMEASFGQAPKIVARPATPDSWVRGLILRGSGGPSVRRGQNLTLDWLPVADGVELVLMGHLRVYNATPETVTTLLDPSVATVDG
jgi:hypothetical protein